MTTTASDIKKALAEKGLQITNVTNVSSTTSHVLVGGVTPAFFFRLLANQTLSGVHHEYNASTGNLVVMSNPAKIAEIMNYVIEPGRLKPVTIEDIMNMGIQVVPDNGQYTGRKAATTHKTKGGRHVAID